MLHEENAPVHVSGHGSAEELRTVLALLRPEAASCRCTASTGCRRRTHGWREDAGVARGPIVIAENGSVVELTATASRSSTRCSRASRSSTGSESATSRDVALRDRRRLSEDGVVIVVATLAASNGGATSAARADRPRLRRRASRSSTSCATRPTRTLRDLLAQNITEIKLLQEHLHDDVGQLLYDRTRRRPMILPVIVEV